MARTTTNKTRTRKKPPARRARGATSKPDAAAAEKGRGRRADTPSEVPARGWKDIGWRLYAAFTEDHAMLVAAGATYYMLLALFPALTAFVSLYGFVADPLTVADHIAFLGGVLPAGGYEIIRDQLTALAEQEVGALSFGFLLGLAIALWSANAGIKSMFEAMNIAYREKEKRSFLMLNLVSLGFTFGAILIAILLIVMVGVVPAALAMLGADGWSEVLVRWLRWPVMLVFVAFAISLVYRYGPSRERAKWRWLSWGAVLATLVWVVASIGFSWYLENFADYNATYGTLGAVIGFMVWTWISVMIIVVGAELNAALEHQTAKDTTTGPARPMGERGAVVADTLGAAQD